MSAAEAAAWLAEAWTSGNSLAPFPPELAPADRAGGALAAERVDHHIRTAHATLALTSQA